MKKQKPQLMWAVVGIDDDIVRHVHATRGAARFNAYKGAHRVVRAKVTIEQKK